MRALVRFFATGLALLAATAWNGWAIGQVMTDRTAWSQWLHWIPAPLALLVALVLFAAVRVAWPLRPRDPDDDTPARSHLQITARVLTWCVLIVTVVRAASVEHRLLAKVPDAPPGIAVMQWTIGESERLIYDEIAAQIIGHDPHIAIMTDAPWIGVESSIKDWLDAAGGRALRFRSFNVLTRAPLREARMIIQNDEFKLVRIVLDVPEMPDGRLCLAVLDMPSEPLRSRRRYADRAIELIRTVEVGNYDLVVGDFNMQRGSESMERIVRALLPDADDPRHAFSEGGHGFAATWSEQLPLWHIDHIWLADDVSCSRYDTPLGAGFRHYPQIAWITPRSE